MSMMRQKSSGFSLLEVIPTLAIAIAVYVMERQEAKEAKQGNRLAEVDYLGVALDRERKYASELENYTEGLARAVHDLRAQSRKQVDKIYEMGKLIPKELLEEMAAKEKKNRDDDDDDDDAGANDLACTCSAASNGPSSSGTAPSSSETVSLAGLGKLLMPRWRSARTNSTRLTP